MSEIMKEMETAQSLARSYEKRANNAERQLEAERSSVAKIQAEIEHYRSCFVYKTLRDEYAVAALNGLLASGKKHKRAVTALALEIADDMMNRRKK